MKVSQSGLENLFVVLVNLKCIFQQRKKLGHLYLPITSDDTFGCNTFSETLLVAIYQSLTLESLSHPSLWAERRMRGFFRVQILSYSQKPQGLNFD